MNKTLSIFGIIVSIVFGLIIVPGMVHAETEVDPGTQQDIVSITEHAEAGIMDALPDSVKNFFTDTFHSIENFRLQQVASATIKRDEFAQQYQDAQGTDEGAGISLTAKYYGYKFYVSFVSSPIMFYLLGSFVVVYIIGTLINRARRRGE